MNIEPLKSFLEEEMSPADLISILSGLLDDYVDLIVDQQLKSDEVSLDVRSKDYIHTLRRLRDILVACK